MAISSSSILSLIIFSFTFSLYPQVEHKQKEQIPISGWEQVNVPTNINRIETTIDMSSQSGQWIAFKNWNEGKAVVAENDSIVWVGTPVGLVRWNVNSRTYQTFDENNGLEFTTINSLAIDKTGKLWMAATQGVVVYSNGIFTHYNYKNTPLPYSAMKVICVDNKNRIVVAFGPPLSGGWYQDGGIARFDGNTWQIWSYGTSIYWGPTFSMCVYNDTVWIGGGQDLFILTDNTFDRAPDWTFGGVYSLVVDYQDSLWVEIFGRKTLKRTGSGWEVIIDRDNEGMGGLFYDIWNDPRGGLWLSMREIWWADYGPYRLDINLRRQGTFCGTSYAGICNVPGIPGQFYAHHAVNESTQFFVHNWGLFKFDGTNWITYKIPRGLYSNEIYSLGCSPNGDVYLSSPLAFQKTNGNQWDSLGGSGWINPPIRFKPDGSVWLSGIPTNPPRYVTGLDFDGYGAYWGAYGSVMTFNHTGFKEWRPSDIGMGRPFGYWSPQFMDIVIDKNEFIWATGWYNGTVMFDRTNWYPFYRTDIILPNGSYDRIFADSRGRIWFSSHSSPNYGFSMYDGFHWYTFYSPQRYSISYVYQFAEDHFGNVWLATGGGLLKYDGSTFVLFDSDNSLLNTNYISAVTIDLRGNVWVGTNTGLYVYNPSGEVKLGQYLYTSPIDSLIISPTGKFAKATFQTQPNSSFPIRYQLQRGRGTHKFWTIAEVEYSTNIPTTLEINDSSVIIGQYYYRIQEATTDGRVRRSSPVQFIGGTPAVNLLSFEHYVNGNYLYLKWATQKEQFTERFEIWRKNSEEEQFQLIRSISSDPTNIDVKYYEIEIDSLRHSAQSINYSLRVIYSDSARSELGILDIRPQLPIRFTVSKNYPNPFNNSTTFDIEMPNPGFVTIKLFDILGREIPSSFSQHFNEGFHKFQINLPSLSSGVYFYFVESLGQQVTGKLVLLK